MAYSLSTAIEKFSWLGKVQAVHGVGRYDVVEYFRQESGETLFGGVLDGEATCHSYYSLEEALVGCIAIAAEGTNTRADRYFFRMIAPRGE